MKEKLSRKYLFKRIIAKIFVLLLNINIYKNVIYYFNKNSLLLDVEGIFLFLNVPREIENILYINKIINDHSITKYLDIGANYGQFGNCINIDNQNKYLIEANPNLIKYITKLNINANILNKAVYINEDNDNLSFNINQTNSGLSHIVIDDTPDKHLVKVPVITPDKILKLYNIDMNEKLFVKIDVEGLELDILEHFYNVSKNSIFAFEVLNSDPFEKLKRILPDHSFFEARFKYQGNNIKNYNSFLSVIKVFITGSDFLNIKKIDIKSPRKFYSLVFCLPNQ